MGTGSTLVWLLETLVLGLFTQTQASQRVWSKASAKAAAEW